MTEKPNLPPDIRARLAQGGSHEARSRSSERRWPGCRRPARCGRRASTASVTVVGDETRRPYDRPPLSKEFLSGDMTEADLALEADDDDLQAEWLLGRRCDQARYLLLAQSNSPTAPGCDADGVVIATGSRARRWPGCEAMAGVHVIRTIDDAIALRADLRPGAALVVIGAGFIGAEVASTARKLGMDVTVVEAAPTPLAVFSSVHGSAPSSPRRMRRTERS